MSPKRPSVAVITVTRDRPRSLIAAVDSVHRQDYPGQISHIIIGDESAALHRASGEIRRRQQNSIIHNVATTERSSEFNPVFIPSRLGFLRNIGISLATTDYVCYLDDDNTFEPNHVSSLVETIEADPVVDIAYSWRCLRYSDGTPYCASDYLWTPKPRLAVSKESLSRYIYSELIAGGIRTRGDPIVRDTVLDSRGMKVFTVDTSELMVRRSTHEEYKFIVNFEWREMVGDYCDDYAFVKQCYEAGLQFRPSRRATVNYTVGGTSNDTKG